LGLLVVPEEKITSAGSSGVVAAVQRGDIFFDRYDSFLRLREEIEQLYQF
jgi:hypothetical protein